MLTITGRNAVASLLWCVRLLSENYWEQILDAVCAPQPQVLQVRKRRFGLFSVRKDLDEILTSL